MNHIVACCSSAERFASGLTNGFIASSPACSWQKAATSSKNAMHGAAAVLTELTPDQIDGLNAVGALVDHGDPGIAHELRHAVFGDIAVTAEHCCAMTVLSKPRSVSTPLIDRRHQAHMVVRRLPLPRSPERCATSLFSAVHKRSARAASLKALMVISMRRTSGCTMIGSAGLS